MRAISYTIPSDSNVVGNSGHTSDHNNIADMLTLLAGGVAVFNVKNTAYGGGALFNGSADDTTAIQAALTAASTLGGGIVACPVGTAIISQTLQIGSNTTLTGAGIGATTIRTKASSLSGFTQVGSNTGSPMICTTGNAAKSRITISNLTLDGNQANAGGSVAGYADGPECAPVGIWNSSLVTIQGVEVINAVGYSIYLQLCSDSNVTGCRVLSGAGSALGTNQQDGVHLTGCSHIRVENNSIDTGTGTAGDDGVGIQALGTACTDIAVTGNMIRAAQSGVHLAIGGTANISDVAVAGNVIWQVTGADGLRIDTSGSGSVTAVAATGNTFRNLPNHGVNISVPFAGIQICGNEFDTATGSLAFGVFANDGGTDLSVCGNTFSKWGVADGIVIGSSGSGITDFKVDSNVVDMSAGTAAAVGIAVVDSADGSVSGNIVLGSTQSGSIGIKIDGIGTAPTGLTVTGNRVKGWATGIEEVNGGAQPDYITYFSNNCHGNTTGMTISGTHDLPVSANQANFNITT